MGRNWAALFVLGGKRVEDLSVVFDQCFRTGNELLRLINLWDAPDLGVGHLSRLHGR